MNLEEFAEKIGPTIDLLKARGELKILQGVALGLILLEDSSDPRLQVLLRSLLAFGPVKESSTNEHLLKQIRADHPVAPEVEQAVVETVKNLLKEGY